MSDNQLDIEFVDRYLKGKLAETEIESLKSRLADSDFKTAFDQLVATHQAITAEGRSDLKRTLKQWDRQSNRPAARTIRMRTMVGVAASLLLLMVAYFVTRPGIDMQLLAENYLEPYPNVVAPLQKSSSDEPERYQQAFQFYEMGYYGKAEDIFATLDQSDEAVSFFRALNALLNEQPQKALPMLQSISATDDARFQKPAAWYEAMALIMLDEKRQAIDVLTKITEDKDSPFASSASEVLEQI